MVSLPPLKVRVWHTQAAANIGGDQDPPSVASAPSASSRASQKLAEVAEKPASDAQKLAEASAKVAKDAEKLAEPAGGNGSRGGDWESLEWRRCVCMTHQIESDHCALLTEVNDIVKSLSRWKLRQLFH